MARWSGGLQNVAKVTNRRHGKPAKVLIRQNVLDAVGRDVKVFDAFAGSGEMYREVWRKAGGYVGCDQKWFRDERCAYVADNRRVLRSIDLAPFSVFDFDAFGSPWEQMLIVAARRVVRPGERIGVVLTEGSMMKLKQGGIPKALGVAAGLTGKLSGLARWRDEIIERAIGGFAHRIGCAVDRRWQAAGKSAAQVLYIGLVLTGVSDAAERAADSDSRREETVAGLS
ncbi:hypothetical protein ACVMGC_004797 [Bradyrhizobium barranii subsp. barranii]|uniref:hypothetical protein n=1 Tax=Bradyrhizobium liaoningense TaxID=43992 RepID=UPI001BAB9FFB|nr:hypothetical protein [Bradyrhizobium liaoningense]MBR0879132.1 hypothetical protein [Bradyrhizobium liaoningense]